jgi:hypothetical protein
MLLPSMPMVAHALEAATSKMNLVQSCAMSSLYQVLQHDGQHLDCSYGSNSKNSVHICSFHFSAAATRFPRKNCTDCVAEKPDDQMGANYG